MKGNTPPIVEHSISQSSTMSATNPKSPKIDETPKETTVPQNLAGHWNVFRNIDTAMTGKPPPFSDQSHSSLNSTLPEASAIDDSKMEMPTSAGAEAQSDVCFDHLFEDTSTTITDPKILPPHSDETNESFTESYDSLPRSSSITPIMWKRVLRSDPDETMYCDNENPIVSSSFDDVDSRSETNDSTSDQLRLLISSVFTGGASEDGVNQLALDSNALKSGPQASPPNCDQNVDESSFTAENEVIDLTNDEPSEHLTRLRMPENIVTDIESSADALAVDLNSSALLSESGHESPPSSPTTEYEVVDLTIDSPSNSPTLSATLDHGEIGDNAVDEEGSDSEILPRYNNVLQTQFPPTYIEVLDLTFNSPFDSPVPETAPGHGGTRDSFDYSGWMDTDAMHFSDSGGTIHPETETETEMTNVTGEYLSSPTPLITPNRYAAVEVQPSRRKSWQGTRLKINVSEATTGKKVTGSRIVKKTPIRHVRSLSPLSDLDFLQNEFMTENPSHQRRTVSPISRVSPQPQNLAKRNILT